MKKFAFAFAAAIAVILSGNTMSAQGKYGADSAECIKYLSYYKEYYKNKNYDAALPNWRKAYRICPATANQNMLIDGTTMYRKLISQSKDAAQREGLIDTLLTIHKTRAEYYKKYKVTALNNMGSDVSNFYKNDQYKVYTLLNEIISTNGKYTKPSILLFDLNASIQSYQDGKVSAEDVIKTYQANQAYLEDAVEVAKDEDDKADIERVKTDMESLFITSKVASCDDLIALFTPRYESDPNDVNLVTNIVKMMSMTDGCTDNDLYLNAATSWYKLQPTYQSAYFVYKLNAARGNVSDAAHYIEEALKAEDIDAATAADYAYEAATFFLKNGQNSKALTYAEKSATLNADYAGKSYYLIGSIWGSTSCGGDEISRRAPYWVAVDYMEKAKAADPSIADDCNRMISQYRVYYPQTAEAFMYNLEEGQSYTVSCGGMRAVTRVRTQK